MSEMKTWTNEKVSREGMSYPEGVWNDEPDKAHWVDEVSDLDCMINRGPLGALCGYVGVPPGHPLYEKDYYDADVEVHGGLTYAAFCQEETLDPGRGVCHVPLPGREEKVWWLGFDCGHSHDLVPGMISAFQKIGIEDMPWPLNEGTYKTFDYVKAEVEHLARQLAKMGSGTQ